MNTGKIKRRIAQKTWIKVPPGTPPGHVPEGAEPFATAANEPPVCCADTDKPRTPKPMPGRDGDLECEGCGSIWLP